jgi:hypothetical protein
MNKVIYYLIIISSFVTSSLCAQLPSYLPTDGLVGWWPFNGNANDESGNGNNGTVNGATLTEDRNGNSNSAFIFDGSTNSIYFENTGNIANFGNGNFSILQWFKSSSILTGHFCNSLYKFGGTNFYYDLTPRSVNTGLPQFHLASGDGQDWNASGNSSIDNGDWYFLCGIRNANTIQFYINGLLQSTIGIPANASADNIGNLGVYPNPCSASTSVEVYIDDIAIYDRALTTEEITAMYTATPNNNNGGNTNTASVNVPAAISYQAIARNAQGQPLSNTALQVKFTMLSDSLTGTTEYSELHSLTTNDLGLFTTAFGTGTPLSGIFADINWTSGNKYVKLEADQGSGFIEMGTQQLLSVPYAMHSNSSAKSGTIENASLPVYADNTAALAGGLQAGQMYRTATGDLKIVY